MSEPAPQPAAPDPSDPLGVGSDIESIRSTTKWVMAALGAVAGLVVAGLDLVDLRALDGPDALIPVAGLMAALASVMWALKAAAHVLVRRRFGLHQLVEALEPGYWGDDAFDAIPNQFDSVAPSAEVPPETRDERRFREELGPIASYIRRQPDLLVYVAPLSRVERRRRFLIELSIRLSWRLRDEELRAGRRWEPPKPKAEESQKAADAKEAAADSPPEEAAGTTLNAGTDPLPPAPPVDVAALGLSQRDCDLLGISEEALASTSWPSQLELIGYLSGAADKELIEFDNLAKTTMDIARLEVFRRRFEHAMRVLVVATIVFGAGIACFAATLPNKAVEPPKDKAPCILLVPSGLGGLNLTQEQVDEINEAGNSIDIDQLLDVVEGVTDVAATKGELAKAAMEKLGPEIIEALGANVVKPLVEDWLGGDETGEVDGPPPGWSVVLRMQLQYRFLNEGLDPAVATELVDLLIRAIEDEIGPDPGAGAWGDGGSATANQTGPSVVVINQNDGRVVTVLPDRTG